MNSLIIIGLAAMAGLFSGHVANRFKIPVVAGYVIIGVLLGSSVLGVFSNEALNEVGLVSSIALSFIAFVIGEELELISLKRLGKSIMLISIFEALIAFVLVTAAMQMMQDKLYLSLLLGAVASATAPAATLMVLRETQAKGVLTTSIMAVVAIDDAIALILYSFAASLAKVLMLRSPQALPWVAIIFNPLKEIVCAIITGILCGLALAYIARKMKSQNDMLILIVGTLLITTGLARFLHLPELLTNMAMGVTFCNYAPNLSRRAFSLTATVTPPLYCMFFVLAGARLQVNLITKVGLLGLVYTLTRFAGKIGGAKLGAYLGNAPATVQKYLGYALLSQIGVAIGLAIMIAQEFPPNIYGQEGQIISTWVINILLFTTIITEIIGPIMTRHAVHKAVECK
ncbi:MAG: cation:proton antiporter [Candidatus Schekmanbacteria bacterium]|nr:cation:proton antiporter [Candidatus Schekmanbacteria bacterium]